MNSDGAKRVVHIIGDLCIGGAEMSLYKLIPRISRERFSSSVVCLIDRGVLIQEVRNLNVPVYNIGINPSWPSPIGMLRLIRKVRRIQPDLIQGWMYHGNLAAQMAAMMVGKRVPVLWNIRGSHYLLKNEKPLIAASVWLGAKLSGLPAGIINNSASSAHNHEETLSYRRDKRIIIPNGFDTTLFAPSKEARESVRAELGLSEDSLLIGLIGRFNPVKDHTSFLRAAATLVERHPSTHLLLAGTDIDSDNGQLNGLADELRISDRAHLIGERQDMPRVIAALDIAVSASYSEGFPNVIGEAMSCGLPCVVTDVGESAWLVGETGRVVPPRDPDALASAMDELIEMGGDRRRQLGVLARQRVIEHFSLDTVSRQYEALYESVLGMNGRGEKGRCAVSQVS